MTKRSETLCDAELRQFVHEHGFATITVATSDGLDTFAVPLLVHVAADGREFLHGHLARNQPAWQTIPAGSPTAVSFVGPHHYISPNWYPTKQRTGMAVPTWNYVVARANGRIRVISDRQWLLDHLRALTDLHEASETDPWRLDDAPADYVDRLVAAIVGIEIEIDELQGRAKLGRHRSDADRLGVIAALEAKDTPAAAAFVEQLRRAEQL